MKGTIIGTDLLQKGDSVKILEINTNTTIFNEGADMLDYDGLFSVLTNNNITEFHFIYTEGDSHSPLIESYRFEDIIKERCETLNIEYFQYLVPNNSITVPYIEDKPNRFILRQSFDTTALVDETYSADKFEFFNLMSGSEYVPMTYISSSTINIDTFTTLSHIDGLTPNTLEKHRYPFYEPMEYPAIYALESDTQLTDSKVNLDVSKNNLLQEFVYDEQNIVDGRWSVIRSIDIIYGGGLDTINMGGYRQSTFIPIDFTSTELVENSRKLNQKSRYKYLTKSMGNFAKIDYHTDEDTMILDYTGSLKDVDTIKLGDYIKSINFVDFNGNNASNFEEGKLDVFGWDSTLTQTSASLTEVSSSLNGIVSASVGTIYIRMTLENGETWTDAPSCAYYIEESGSISTRFEKVNKMVVGDKLVTMHPTTNELSLVTITGLEMEYTEKMIYSLDFEPSDLFLVDVGDGLFGIMHNSCWCPWIYCGYYCHSTYCRTCAGRFAKR
jgi:hypothetical protein